MASLLERMDISGTGPVRNRGERASSSPYSRPAKDGRSKADADTVWKHDLYAGPKGLEARLSGVPVASSDSGPAPRVNASGAVSALRQAVGGGGARGASGADLSIKGASTGGFNMNVVQVDNLASGTSAADVEAIFKRCGPILEAYNHRSQNADRVTVRLKFKNADDARRAVAEYNGKSADGHVLAVTLKGSTSTALSGRLAGGVPVVGDSVDVLMGDDSETGGSKMRSDELLNDPRAVVLTIPPGVDPAEYAPRGRGRRGRGGRPWARGRRGAGMVVG